MLAEVHGWEKFDGKFLVPFYAADLVSSQFEGLRVLRQYTLALVSDYNQIVASFDEVESKLSRKSCRRLDRKLAPGLSRAHVDNGERTREYFSDEMRCSPSRRTYQTFHFLAPAYQSAPVVRGRASGCAGSMGCSATIQGRPSSQLWRTSSSRCAVSDP